MNRPFRIICLIILTVFLSPLFMGCSRVQPRFYEGSCDRPYVTLGIGEVSVKAPRKILKGEKSEIRAEKRANKLRKKLNKKLLKRARKLYHADAVSKVQYWPALNSLDFGQKSVFARAEMVRYSPFPEASNAENPPASQPA